MPETSERIVELRRELESNPSSRQFYQLGELLRREGRAAEAISVLRAGLGHHPRYVAALVSLGRACLDSSRPDQAVGALHDALELDGQNPVAWRLLGEARLAGGDRFGALDAMQHALQLAPGDEVLRAAVESLGSETWPPDALAEAARSAVSVAARLEEAAAPAASAEGVDAEAPGGTAPASESFEAGPEPPTGEPEPLTAAPELVAAGPEPSAVETQPEPMSLRPSPESAARRRPEPPIRRPAAPPPAGPFARLEDPFAVSAPAGAPAALLDVFAAVDEAPAFGDQPFGALRVGPEALPAFLAEYAPPSEAAAALSEEPPAEEPSTAESGSWLATKASAAATEEPPADLPPAGPASWLEAVPAAAAPDAAEEAAQVEPEAPAEAETREEPFGARPAEADEVVPVEEPATPVGFDVPTPGVDAFASTSAFAAAPLDIAAGPPPGARLPERGSRTGVPAGVAEPAPVEPEAQVVADAGVPPEPEPPPAPAAPADAASRPTLTLARLHIQQQDFHAAIAILERLIADDPEHQEARDLLELVKDMMAPLPGELPLLSVRERRIAALQGWLASLALGQERIGP